MMPLDFVWVGLGGALGSSLRAWIGHNLKTSFPWATLLVNVSAAFFIGLLITLANVTHWIPHWDVEFDTAGFCGSFSTFSAFTYQTVDFLRKGKVVLALVNMFLSLALCFIAVYVGHVVAMWLIR
jgi:fluoride exporter